MNRALAIAALVISLVALGWSLRGAPEPVVRPTEAPAAAQVAADCVRRDELLDMERRLLARVSSAERQLVAVRASALDAGLKVSPEGSLSPQSDAPPRYVRFEAPSPGLTVRQDSDTAFSATNTDPTQTGKMVLVKAVQADGGTRLLPLVVPAPAQ